MGINGIGWHAVVANGSDDYETTRDFFAALLGGGPTWDADGYAAFGTADGSNLEVLSTTHVPTYGFNGGVAFGFSVDDLTAASEAVVAAGGTLLGEVVDPGPVVYRHFQDPAGRTYALVQPKG